MTNSPAMAFHCHNKSDHSHLISHFRCLEERVLGVFSTITQLFLYRCALKCSGYANVWMEEPHRGQSWSFLSATGQTLGRHSLWQKWPSDTAAGKAGLRFTWSGSLPLSHLCIWKIVIMENSLAVILISCVLRDQYNLFLQHLREFWALLGFIFSVLDELCGNIFHNTV